MANKNDFDQDDQKELNEEVNNQNEEQQPSDTSTLSLREQVLASLSENPIKPVEKKTVFEPEQEESFENTRVHAPFTPISEEEEPSERTVPVPVPLEEGNQEEVLASRSEQTAASNPRKAESRRRKEQRQKEDSLVTKIVIIVVTLLVLVISVLGIYFYRYWQAGLEPLDSSDDKLVQVNIPIGTSNKGIGAILEKDNIIKSGLVFTYFVKTSNLTDFKGGYYQMSPNMTLEQIGRLLQEGGTEEAQALADAQITIPEGLSIDQIVETIVSKTKLKAEDIMAVIEDPAFFDKLLASYPELLDSVKDAKDVRYRLEGYLFPATYNYYADQPIESFLTEMVAKSNSVLSPRYPQIKERGYTVQQVLTLASLVEREGVNEEDRRDIAQVFFNRLDIDMPLQSDISILYAMNEHKVHLSNKDTQIDSPYNLYIHTGFGPGPFNSPSEQAIDAVLNPTENKYIYFLADVTTGKVYFAETYEEHLKLKEKYIDNLE